MRAKPPSEFAEIAVEIIAEISPRLPPRSRRDDLHEEIEIDGGRERALRHEVEYERRWRWDGLRLEVVVEAGVRRPA